MGQNNINQSASRLQMAKCKTHGTVRTYYPHLTQNHAKSVASYGPAKCILKVDPDEGADAQIDWKPEQVRLSLTRRGCQTSPGIKIVKKFLYI